MKYRLTGGIDMKCFYFFHFCPQLYWALLSCGQKNRLLAVPPRRTSYIELCFPVGRRTDCQQYLHQTLGGVDGGKWGWQAGGGKSYRDPVIVRAFWNQFWKCFVMSRATTTPHSGDMYQSSYCQHAAGPSLYLHLHSNYVSVHPIFNIRELRLREVKWLPQVHKRAQLS